jgi:putative DNA primase/helicase
VLGRERSSVHVALQGYPAHKFDRAGSLDDRRGEVAALAAGNHALVFALALAFAPPLLRLLGDEPGGFQLVAPTRTGESTAAELAASVWGSRFAEKWRTTVNSVERTAADHNDLLLVLDEVGLLAKDPRSRADELYEACHQLGGGRGKQRLNVADPPREWLVLFLSTSELTFRRILAAGGRAVVGGELMRLIDVVLPVDPPTGIFQDLHGHATVDQYCAALDHAVARCHGTAGRAYLRRLVREVEDDRDALVSWLRERIDWYLRRTSSAVGGRGAEAVASRFALVYAAGRLAAR